MMHDDISLIMPTACSFTGNVVSTYLNLAVAKRHPSRPELDQQIQRCLEAL